MGEEVPEKLQGVCESYEMVNLHNFVLWKEFMVFFRVLK